MDDLYREEILDHYRSSAHRGRLPNADATFEDDKGRIKTTQAEQAATRSAWSTESSGFLPSRWPPFLPLSKSHSRDEAPSLDQLRVVEDIGPAVWRQLVEFESTKLSTCL